MKEKKVKQKAKKVKRGVFRVLTGVIMGGAIGSILGLTLAPKKGRDSREYLRDQSMKMFLEGKKYIHNEKKMGFFKRSLVKLLTKKKK